MCGVAGILCFNNKYRRLASHAVKMMVSMKSRESAAHQFLATNYIIKGFQPFNFRIVQTVMYSH